MALPEGRSDVHWFYGNGTEGAAGRALRVAPSVAQQPGEGAEQAEQGPRTHPRRSGDPNAVVELPSEDGQLQQVGHATPVHLAVLGQSERVLDERLEPSRRPDFDTDERLRWACVPP